ncbi:MAG: T9SS type A sorting domain-containing protein [Bacteroidetes bacterium]|nr:T9SS type A sorting domain-containing protein [Bacteroidota bacterium]
MKRELPTSESILNRFFIILVLFVAGLLLTGTSSQAQIYEPEGLNMPGAWNTWNNPPANNLALASYTQVTGGRVVKFSTGIQRWQTIFSVAATGGDLVGGTYEWLFTSGPTGSPWNNKWSNTNATINTLQSYTKEGAANNTLTLTNDKWYTMNFEDAGYINTRAIFMETSAQPVTISYVSTPEVIDPGNAAVIAVTISAAPSPEELFYLRYSTDAWVTSAAVPVSVSGIYGSASIPGQVAGTVVSYYAFSSTITPILADYDLYTIKLNSNGGTNYSYTVTTPVPVVTFANLQNPPAGTIDLGGVFQVSGRVEIPGLTGQPVAAPGLLAWVGYSSTNTDPATWTNWIAAPYAGPVLGKDEFSADLGPVIPTAGTWYYATRFSLNAGSYLYGGYSVTGGGLWDGTVNISGVLTVQTPEVPMFQALENITVAAEQSVCYNAKQTITAGGNGSFFNVENGGSVMLIAGQNIIFLPSVTVVSGGFLHAYLTKTGEYCNSPGIPAVKDAMAGGNSPAGSGTLTVMVYPNPATARVTIDLLGVADGVVSGLELFSTRGNRLYSQTLTGSGTRSLDVTGFPSGVYFVRIVSGSQVQTRMLVKQ